MVKWEENSETDILPLWSVPTRCIGILCQLQKTRSMPSASMVTGRKATVWWGTTAFWKLTSRYKRISKNRVVRDVQVDPSKYIHLCCSCTGAENWKALEGTRGTIVHEGGPFRSKTDHIHKMTQRQCQVEWTEEYSAGSCAGGNWPSLLCSNWRSWPRLSGGGDGHN